MLLYLVEYSRPDIANCIQELTNCLGGSTEARNKEMHHMIKFVLDTKGVGIKLCPTGVFSVPKPMTVFTDSNYIGDSGCSRSACGRGYSQEK